MPKVSGPLLSNEARGTIFGQLTARHTNGQATIRRKGQSTKPLTEAQQLHHAAFSNLAAAWSNATDADKATWLPLADPDEITAYNAYLRFNFARLAAGETTTTVYPPVELPTVTLTITPGSPAPVPDCTGDYITIGQQDGKPVYSRYPDHLFQLAWNQSANRQYIFTTSEELGFAIWMRAAATPGTFNPYAAATGKPITHLP